MPNPAVAGCLATYDPFLHATSSTPGPDFARDFTCIATLGTEGCGFEQPLAAMEKALTVQVAPGGPDAGFLRDDAALAIVILSDENDCSAADTTMFDPEGPGGPLGVRCTTMADHLAVPDRFVASLNGVKPDGRLVVAMMVGVPPAVGACNTTGDAIAPCLAESSMAETIDPGTGIVRPVCENLPDTRAYPGLRFVQLARLLGRKAFVQSICNPQFETFFRHLAQLAQTP
jgi:hypothetical protein